MVTLHPIMPDHPFWTQVERLYTEAFPECERRPLAEFAAKAAGGLLTVEAISVAESDGGRFCGFLTWWDMDGYVYGEHFATLPECRGGGVGSLALQSFLARSGKPVVLETELATDSITSRRVRFYERNGFRVAPYPYAQPPYVSGGEWVPMQLMTWGMALDGAAFAKVRAEIYSRVYNM